MDEVKVAILGAAGRMGRMLVEASRTEGIRLVAAIEQPDHPLIGKDAGDVASIGNIGVTITDAKNAEPADVYIDFTFHTAVPGNLENAIAAGAKGYVLATTGLDDSEKAALEAAAERLAIVHSANMSLGVNLLLGLVQKAAAILDSSYDIEIVEMHHRHKKDAPSGTAVALANAAADGREVRLDDVAVYGREGISGERPFGEIAIHALRGGEVVGDHTVIFAGEHERVEITHKAASRAAFAKGSMLAAKWLPGRAAGIYSMRDVLGLA
jgi:4-hydroxy-tetrahydrodipicolinate reductase